MNKCIDTCTNCSALCSTMQSNRVRAAAANCKACSLSVGFDSQSWYKHLFEYGVSGDAATSVGGSDPDEELVPRLVAQLVLPLAAHSLQHAWNPHSRRSTAAAKAMLEDLLIYVPPEEPKLQVRHTTMRVLLAKCHESGRQWCAASS